MANDGYVPPHIQREMDQHLQRMPANLQKYQSGNTYIPSQAATSMSSYMEKNLPAHLKQYIPQYMEQKVIAGRNSLDPVTPRVAQERAPAPNLMRRDHSGFGEQFTVNLGSTAQGNSRNSLSFSPQYTAGQKPETPTQNGSQNPYDFITNSTQPKRGFGGGSFKQRLLIVGIGFGLLLVAGIVFIAILGSGGSSNTKNLIKIAQEQTEIVRVAGIGKDKATSAQTKNLAITTQLSLQSAQADTIALLKKSGHKVNDKQLALSQDPHTDQQLNDANSAGTFDATFTDLLQKELNSYRRDLQNTYSSSTNNTVRQSLQADFNSASIILGAQK